KSNVGFLAREWINLLEELRVKYEEKLSEGVYHDDFPKVKISVEPNHSSQKSLPEHLQNGTNDSTVLAVAMNLIKDVTNSVDVSNLVLMSNDTPMRIKATT